MKTWSLTFFAITWQISSQANTILSTYHHIMNLTVLLAQASGYDQSTDNCFTQSSLSCSYCCLQDKLLCTNDRSLCEPSQPDRQVDLLGMGILYILAISIGTIGLAKLLGVLFMYPCFKKKKRGQERYAGQGTCCQKFGIIFCCGCFCQCNKLQKNYRPGKYNCCGKQKPEETNSAFKASGTFFS